MGGLKNAKHEGSKALRGIARSSARDMRRMLGVGGPTPMHLRTNEQLKNTAKVFDGMDPELREAMFRK